jgi:uncharacterized membrane protein
MAGWRKDRSSWWRTAGLAALSGSRTTLGPAFVAKDSARLRRLRPLMLGMAACELVIDKLPGIPNRTVGAPLMARALTGSLVALASRTRLRPGGAVVAAALGAVAATVGALVAFRLRRRLSGWLGGGKIANAASGVIEDGLALASGRALTAAGRR